MLIEVKIMPRSARQKSQESTYHVMSRSISEIDLFRSDEDKVWYLKLIKRYIEKYHCKVYAYCLMSNHVHLFINPCGFDISTFMLSLNTAYVTYYNKRYKRHGHLFQGRFTSKIVDSDTYGLTLSAYIHNNAKDIAAFSGKEEAYRFSSYGIYTGCRKDIEGIIDTGFVLGFFSCNLQIAQQKYKVFVSSLKDKGILNKLDESIMQSIISNTYKSEKQLIPRYRNPENLIMKIGELFNEKMSFMLKTKHSRHTSQLRAFVTYIMRALCGYSYKQICSYIGNMSLSGITRLSSQGFRLLHEHLQYQDAFNMLVMS
jgi:REP element-mobilizing transposase RayT